ncbi:helix-turn-helix domain-containing protein [Isobaculum melis]|uniref:Mga helix-turn-helix domain-containing protein n=1 Tax=Isobaculum melis TaxID=142588 RepID=A0A1H9UFA4_9LACT|nr:helix-turn-helix domain-containing protein [Isobaculum melis]SES08125.1 Mga helix-turn-helix domain-containing protein [Isobaculum melis]
MYRLLDKKYIKRMEIIKKLYENTDNLKVSDIGKQIGNDFRTTLLLLEDIQKDIMTNQWENLLQFNVKPVKKSTIDITIGESFSLNTFYAYYMKKSFCFEFCMAIFTGQYQTLQAFSEEHYVSIPTIYRKIKPLKELLEEFRLTLDLATPNLINGKEHHIRYFFFVLFWEIFHSSNIFFKDATKIRKLVNSIGSQYFSFSPASLLKLEIMLAIIIVRREQSCFLVEAFSLEIYSKTLKDFKAGILQFFEYFNLSNKSFLENDVDFLYSFFTLTDTYSWEHFENLPLEFFSFSAAAFQVAKQWVALFSSFFSIKLSTQDKHYLLINLICIHTRKDFFPENKFSIGTTSYQEVLNKTHPHLLKHMLLFFKVVEKQTTITLNDQLRLSYAVLVRDMINRLGPSLNLCVFSSINEEQQQSLVRHIKRYCSMPLHFESTISATTDLVISDFPMDYSFFDYQQESHFQWNSFPTQKEWTALTKKMEDLYFNAFDQIMAL